MACGLQDDHPAPARCEYHQITVSAAAVLDVPTARQTNRVPDENTKNVILILKLRLLRAQGLPLLFSFSPKLLSNGRWFLPWVFAQCCTARDAGRGD